MNNISDYKDIITIVLSLATFFLVGILVYWRENRKSFQEKIFEYKYAAYKEIVEQIGIYHQEVFALLETFQDFEGTEEEWQKIMLEECPEYYDKARMLDRLYFKHLVILPEKQLERLRELNFLAAGHVTNHFHFKTPAPHLSYDRIWDGLIDFALEARKDISTDILNSTLSKRLSHQFYPISLPKKKLTAESEEGNTEQDEPAPPAAENKKE